MYLSVLYNCVWNISFQPLKSSRIAFHSSGITVGACESSNSTVLFRFSAQHSLELDKVSVVTETCVFVCVKTRYTIGHSIIQRCDTHIWKERDIAGISLHARTHTEKPSVRRLWIDFFRPIKPMSSSLNAVMCPLDLSWWAPFWWIDS